MTIPARRDAARLLRSLDPPPWFVRHACAVADVAAWLATRTNAARAGQDQRLVDPTLAATAALLHDIDKLPAAGAPGRLRHGDGSAWVLERHGFSELAPVVRDHPVTRLAESGWDGWLADATPEARIVAYADKRAGQRLEPMAERFTSWRRRYPSGPREARTADLSGAPDAQGWDEAVVRLVESRAAELERQVCAAADVGPSDVRRLRWSGRALAEAGA
jgi:HD domain